MDGTTLAVLLFVLVFFGAIGYYIYYVNQAMAEAGFNKKSNSGKKPKKKDRQAWSIGG
uniref:Uncharacterized protein n=1 Tax=Pfiesteria piscicida TaxID=71001 RepID=A3E3P7_PFIPI|nr:unknown [Pfiesteria piscicida]